MDKIDLLILTVIIVLVTGLFVVNTPSFEINVDLTQYNHLKTFKSHVLGINNNGTVFKSGPYGNPNSTQKIAFIIGVHPLEQDSHEAILESILTFSKGLKSTYYIYIVDVTKDRNSYNNGRMNGQILANEYVVPDIQKNNFTLAIDVHSTIGGNYQKTRFIFVPWGDNRTMFIASNILNNIPWLEYYVPPKESGPVSSNYVTIPLIKSGTPAIIYETYRFEPFYVTAEHADEFILTVDNM